MKSGPECDQKAIADKLKKLPLDEIEEIYLPLLNNCHWFLAVVNFVTEIVEFYDSLLVLKEGEHPHKYFGNNLCGNLQEAYSISKKRSVFIQYFVCTYPGKRIQSTNHDCGYQVIQQLECLNSEDLIGHSKKSMTAFRKYLCHILVYHRLTDLNPLRPHLREEEP